MSASTAHRVSGHPLQAHDLAGLAAATSVVCLSLFTGLLHELYLWLQSLKERENNKKIKSMVDFRVPSMTKTSADHSSGPIDSAWQLWRAANFANCCFQKHDFYCSSKVHQFGASFSRSIYYVHAHHSSITERKRNGNMSPGFQALRPKTKLSCIWTRTVWRSVHIN